MKTNKTRQIPAQSALSAIRQNPKRVISTSGMFNGRLFRDLNGTDLARVIEFAEILNAETATVSKASGRQNNGCDLVQFEAGADFIEFVMEPHSMTEEEADAVKSENARLAAAVLPSMSDVSEWQSLTNSLETVRNMSTTEEKADYRKFYRFIMDSTAHMRDGIGEILTASGKSAEEIWDELFRLHYGIDSSRYLKVLDALEVLKVKYGVINK